VSRRLGAYLASVVVGLGVVVIGGAVSWRSEVGMTLAELRHMKSTIPAPSTWTTTSSDEGGEDCRLRPAWSARFVRMTYETAQATSCAEVAAVERSWRRSLHVHAGLADPSSCSFTGIGREFSYTVLLFGDEQSEVVGRAASGSEVMVTLTSRK
jgi:hypothetical protein